MPPSLSLRELQRGKMTAVAWHPPRAAASTTIRASRALDGDGAAHEASTPRSSRGGATARDGQRLAPRATCCQGGSSRGGATARDGQRLAPRATCCQGGSSGCWRRREKRRTRELTQQHAEAGDPSQKSPALALRRAMHFTAAPALSSHDWPPKHRVQALAPSQKRERRENREVRCVPKGRGGLVIRPEARMPPAQPKAGKNMLPCP